MVAKFALSDTIALSMEPKLLVEPRMVRLNKKKKEF